MSLTSATVPGDRASLRAGRPRRRAAPVAAAVLLMAGAIAAGDRQGLAEPEQFPPVQAWSSCRLTILEPKVTQVLYGRVGLSAEVLCPKGTEVADVLFLVDGEMAALATRSPYRASLDVGESFSAHRVEARLTDSHNRMTTAVVFTPASNLHESLRITSTPIDLVELSVAVYDHEWRPVHGLTRDDFIVKEHGRVQRIEMARPETRPLSVTLLVDVSSSMSDLWPRLRQAAPTFARTLGPYDMAKVVAFAGPAYMIQDFTRDPAAIATSLAGFRRWGGGTSLYDTLAAAGAELAWARGGRQAVVLLTDGLDTLSRIDAPRLRNYLRRTDVAIEVFLLTSKGIASSPGYGRSRGNLEMLCRETGGSIHVLDDFAGMERAFRELGQDLQDRYDLSYHSDRAGRKDGWRSIEVSTRRPGTSVRTRAGVIDRRDIAENLEIDLKKGDVMERSHAADWLGRMPTPGTADALLEALQDRSIEVRAVAAVALARQREPRAMAPIIELLASRDDRLQIAATEALRTFGPPAVPPLIEALNRYGQEANDEAQVRALEALADIDDGGSLEAIGRVAAPLPPMTAPRDRDEAERMARRRRTEPRVRAWALWAVGRIGRPEGLPILLRAYEDADPGVRQAALGGVAGVLGVLLRDDRLEVWAASNSPTFLRIMKHAVSGGGPAGEETVQAIGGAEPAATLLEKVTQNLPSGDAPQAREIVLSLRAAAHPASTPQ